jgi:hypothetical protein
MLSQSNGPLSRQVIVALCLLALTMVVAVICASTANASIYKMLYASGVWTVQSPPNPIPSTATIKATYVDGGVSCEAAGNCMGVGYYEDSTGLKVPVAMYYG